MSSKTKMKKNLTRLVCLVLAGIMLIGCFAAFTMKEVERHDYSAGLTDKGFFEGVTALDNVILPDYKAFTMPEEYTVATDAEIDARVEEIRSTFAKQEKETDTERVIAKGDSINMDYVGKIDGVEFEGGSTQGAGSDAVIGSGSFIPGFEEQVEGMSIGEEKDITVKFPEDYHAENLKGKDAVFAIKLHEIKAKELPEVNDEFIKEAAGNDIDIIYEKLKMHIKDVQKEAREKYSFILPLFEFHSRLFPKLFYTYLILQLLAL